MRKITSRILLAITMFCFSAVVMAQQVRPQQPGDSTKSNGPGQRPTSGPRPYREVITDKAVTKNGFFKVHKVDDKYFFEIPNDLLWRDILVVNRISQTQA